MLLQMPQLRRGLGAELLQEPEAIQGNETDDSLKSQGSVWQD